MTKAFIAKIDLILSFFSYRDLWQPFSLNNFNEKYDFTRKITFQYFTQKLKSMTADFMVS